MTIDIKGLTQANESREPPCLLGSTCSTSSTGFVEGGLRAVWILGSGRRAAMGAHRAIVDPVADDAIRSLSTTILGEHRGSSQSRAPDSQNSASPSSSIPLPMLSKAECCARGHELRRRLHDLRTAEQATVHRHGAGEGGNADAGPEHRRRSRLEIRYAYVHTGRVGGEWIAEARMYRRIIDDKRDVAAIPVRCLSPSGRHLGRGPGFPSTASAGARWCGGHATAITP